jgi:hypothetical protein
MTAKDEAAAEVRGCIMWRLTEDAKASSSAANASLFLRRDLFSAPSASVSIRALIHSFSKLSRAL